MKKWNKTIQASLKRAERTAIQSFIGIFSVTGDLITSFFGALIATILSIIMGIFGTLPEISQENYKKVLNEILSRLDMLYKDSDSTKEEDHGNLDLQ